MSASPGLPSKSRDAQWTVFLLAGLALLLCLRLIALSLNVTDLFFDEAQYWAWSEEPAFGYYSKPPLIAWIIRGATEVCGLGESCIRLPSPFLHTLDRAGYLRAGQQALRRAHRRPVGPRLRDGAGRLAVGGTDLHGCAAAFVLGVSAHRLRWSCSQRSRLWPALLLGVAFGVGLNGKYAMAWFIVCTTVYLVLTPERRSILKDYRLYLALALGLCMIVPNLVWNYAHAFATFSHTADNANWSGSLLHPDKALAVL